MALELPKPLTLRDHFRETSEDRTKERGVPICMTAQGLEEAQTHLEGTQVLLIGPGMT